jgi:hypothetical protein
MQQARSTVLKACEIGGKKMIKKKQVSIKCCKRGAACGILKIGKEQTGPCHEID